MKTTNSLPRTRVAAEKAVKKTRKTASNFADSFDPNGSYTGTPTDGGKPVQDADDL